MNRRNKHNIDNIINQHTIHYQDDRKTGTIQK